MDSKVNVLDFDDCYQNQSYYRKAQYREIKLLDFKNVSRYCDSVTLKELEQRINSLKEGSITYIGSGNYHYITYLLTNNIKEPFTLIVFDHHTDMVASPDEDVISCGSWILNALENNKYMKKVIVVGINPKLIDTVPDKFKDKVYIITEDELCNFKAVLDKLQGKIGTESVYISIDKDVLDYKDAETNWDQGSLKLKDLIYIIDKVSLKNYVCGVDICGEYTFSPVDMFTSSVVEAQEKNDNANMAILNEINNI